MKRSTVILIFSSLLILLFTYAALSKLEDHAVFKAQLTKFPFIGSEAGCLSWSIPIAELAATLLLLIPRFQFAGFIVSAVMLLVFTLFLVVMVSFKQNLPCSCGGVIATLSWQQHIIFNACFLITSIVGISLKRKQKNLLNT